MSVNNVAKAFSIHLVTTCIVGICERIVAASGPTGCDGCLRGHLVGYGC